MTSRTSGGHSIHWATRPQVGVGYEEICLRSRWITPSAFFLFIQPIFKLCEVWNNSYLNCGCRRKWRVIMAVTFSNLSNWKEEAWKNQASTDSNPWPPRYRCDALSTEPWSHTLGARSIYWVHIFPRSEIIWSIYEIIHIWTAVVDESQEWSSQ